MKPRGKSLPIDVAGRESEHRIHCVILRRFETIAVELEENAGEGQRDTLVPVQKGVVPGYGRGVGRGKMEQVFLTVGKVVSWTRECGVEHPLVEEPRRAPVFCEKLFMDG